MTDPTTLEVTEPINNKKTKKVKKGKKVSFAALSIDQEDQVTLDNEGTNKKQPEVEVSTLKSQLACPSQLLHSLKRQTDLTENQIHTRYMMFRSQYPAGFVGPNVLREICADVLNEEECDEYVDMVFRLYGQKKKGWGVKLIGFREVLLATEGIHKLHRPDEILRWIFRVYDVHAAGEIYVFKIDSIVNSLLGLCVRLKQRDDFNTIQALKKDILKTFATKPYDGNLISEEEFIYDGLHNEALYKVLSSSLRVYNVESEDSGSDSEENASKPSKGDE